MNQQNRIIVLIDFSDYSEALAKFSSEFSKAINAWVVFVHQVPGMVPANTDIDSRQQVIDEEKKEALVKLQSLSQGYSYKRINYYASEKDLLTILSEYKNEDYFDWIFTGLKDTSFLKKIFIGSTTLKIVNNSRLLTVALPIQRTFNLPERLIVAVNPKYPLNKPQFESMLSGLSKQIKKIEFISIITKNDEEQKFIDYLNQLKETFAKYDPDINSFKGADAFTGISNYMAGKDDAFLVVQQGSRLLTDSLFRKFMINELVYNGSTPLIVISQ